MDGASKGILETEFGTSNEDQCIIKILENGEYQATVVCSSPLTLNSDLRFDANLYFRRGNARMKQMSLTVPLALPGNFFLA